MKRIVFDDPAAIPAAVEVLSAGGLIIFPTETCYGLGADATNQEAVQKLLNYKGGRGRKPVSVAVADKAMAADYVDMNEIADHICTTLLPGPVTVISRDKGKVSPTIVSERHTLGIRIPDYPSLLELIRAFGKPITATSANTSNKKTPYSFEELKNYTTNDKLAMVDLFLDGGVLPVRPPSTIVDTTLNEATILRQGEVSISGAVGAREVLSDNEAETRAIAGTILNQYMAELNDKPLIFALQGELGAGKTQFAKGLAQALRITETVASPTYIICKEYPFALDGRQGVFYHIDTWRMENQESLESLGLTGMLQPGRVIAIEWMQKARTELESLKDKATLVWVEIEGDGETDRTIRYLKA